MLHIDFYNGWIMLYSRYVIKTMCLKDVRRLAVLIEQDTDNYNDNVKVLRETLEALEKHGEIDNRRIERVVKAFYKKGIEL